MISRNNSIGSDVYVRIGDAFLRIVVLMYSDAILRINDAQTRIDVALTAK